MLVTVFKCQVPAAAVGARPILSGDFSGCTKLHRYPRTVFLHFSCLLLGLLARKEASPTCCGGGTISSGGSRPPLCGGEGIW